jgi:hypothetical protein
MIAIRPAVQHDCKRARKFIVYKAETKRDDKRIANRAHRRFLNRITRGFMRDLESFYSEDFGAPTLSGWDIY